ncbi:hypothetical protein Ancab_005794 [Ancistrocladus abbreviatus]
MEATKEKINNVASAAKEHIQICKAKVEEKSENLVVGTEEEKVIAHEMAKIKEAEVMAELHAARALHAAEKLEAKKSYYHHVQTGCAGVGHHQPPSPALHLRPIHEDPAVKGAQLNLQPIGQINPLTGIVIPTSMNYVRGQLPQGDKHQ